MKWLAKHSHLLLLVSILAASSVLRIYRIGAYQIFLGDEGRDVLVAYGILHGKFTLLGPTASVGGFFFGPLYYYMIAPFLWLFRYDPVGPAIMVALFGIASVYLVYLVGKRIFSPEVGLMSAFLYGMSPLLVTFSRSSWNPHVVPFFVLLTVLTLERYIKTRRAVLLVIMGFLYGLTFELHFVTLFFAAALVIFFAWFLYTTSFGKWVQATVYAYVLFGLGFLGGILPIIGFEVRHQFVNTRNIITFMFHSKDAGSGAQFLPTVSDVFSRIFERGVFAFPQIEQFKYFAPWQLGIWEGLAVLIGIASVILLGMRIRQTMQKNPSSHAQLIFLACWLFFGVVGFGFYKKNIYEYYFEFLFPLAVILVGSLIVYGWNLKNRIIRLLIVIGLVGVTWIDISQLPFWFPANYQVEQTQIIAREVLHETNGQPFNFALITGGNSDQAYRYFLTLWGHPPVTIDNEVVDPQRKTVTSQLIVVCESLPCAPLGNSLWEVAGFGRAEIASHTPISVVEIYRLTHYTGAH